MSTVAVPEAPAITRPVTGADVLERAADLLEEFGHSKFQYAKDASGFYTRPCSSNVEAFCVSGAVARALAELGGSGGDDDGKYGLRFLYTQGVFSPFESIIGWNDDPGRTKAEVVARLRDAAQRARQPD